MSANFNVKAYGAQMAAKAAQEAAAKAAAQKAAQQAAQQAAAKAAAQAKANTAQNSSKAVQSKTSGASIQANYNKAAVISDSPTLYNAANQFIKDLSNGKTPNVTQIAKNCGLTGTKTQLSTQINDYVNRTFSKAQAEGAQAAKKDTANMNYSQLESYVKGLQSTIEHTSDYTAAQKLIGKAQYAFQALLDKTSNNDTKFDILDKADTFLNSCKSKKTGKDMTYNTHLAFNVDGNKVEFGTGLNTCIISNNNSKSTLASDFKNYKNVKEELQFLANNNDNSLSADTVNSALNNFGVAIQNSTPNIKSEYALNKTVKLFDEVANVAYKKVKTSEKVKLNYASRTKQFFQATVNGQTKYYFIKIQNGKASYISRKEYDGKGNSTVNNFNNDYMSSQAKKSVVKKYR